MNPSAILSGLNPAQAEAVGNKAAGEMRGRVERLLGATGLGVWVGTFDGTSGRSARTLFFRLKDLEILSTIWNHEKPLATGWPWRDP